VPGYVNILGSATNTATVTVNNQATYRRSNYFRAELLVTNASVAVWLSATNLAVLNNGTNADIIASTIGNMYVPQTPEVFAYDADGNLTNDGRWSYTWDAENRATSFTRNSSAPSGSKVKLDCQYDYRSRRTQKIVSSWNGSAYVAQSTNKFVYDGWNLISILDATNGLVQSFTWGTDASGSLQGAGGVGGLISMTVHQGTNAGIYFYCYDGNHNVATLVNATNGAVEAVYELDAFLGIHRATGRLAFVNPFVGSTKFCDWETGFLYYGYRYYDPSTGRWLNRDLIEEGGGANLYGFAGNNLNDFVDAFGLATIRVGFGFDQSVTMDQGTLGLIGKQISTFKSILDKCSNVMKDWAKIDVKRSFDSNRDDKPLPPGNVYNLDDATIVTLVETSIGNIKVTPSAQVLVLITKASISQTWKDKKINPNGNTFKNGILLKIDRAQVSALAHEVGHVVKYVGDDSDKVHSTKEDNVMYKTGGTNPDCQWCEKVADLAK
jgi:RHS repeat-associated protein